MCSSIKCTICHFCHLVSLIKKSYNKRSVMDKIKYLRFIQVKFPVHVSRLLGDEMKRTVTLDKI